MFYKEGCSDKVFEQLLEKTEETGGKKILDTTTTNKNVYYHNIFLWKDAALELTFSSASKMTTANLISTNQDITSFVKELCKDLSSPAKRGYVFAITKDAMGKLGIQHIGLAGQKLERNNYTQNVLKDYDYVVEDLKSKDPTGRVVILDGPPGGGKTYCLRGLLMDVPNAIFVVVPPNMVATISGPELLPILLKTYNDYGSQGNSIVLILEDADEALMPRASDNMSSISSMLALGDGLFGSLFDTRIIATTNARIKEIDKAILRDGRLSKRIHIEPFKYDDANVIFNRLVKDSSKKLPIPEVEKEWMKPQNDRNAFTLAEIYRAARDAGWKPEKKKAAESDTNLSSGTEEGPIQTLDPEELDSILFAN